MCARIYISTYLYLDISLPLYPYLSNLLSPLSICLPSFIPHLYMPLSLHLCISMSLYLYTFIPIRFYISASLYLFTLILLYLHISVSRHLISTSLSLSLHFYNSTYLGFGIFIYHILYIIYHIPTCLCAHKPRSLYVHMSTSL